MTWIVGMPTMFGYSIGISDIRVTLVDDSEHDCLQKIYSIAPCIALGFAGSVYIGFRMVQVMRTWLRCDDPEGAWNPLETAEQWPAIARNVFASSPAGEQAHHCHLMMLSADPVQTNGMSPMTYVHVFRSPDFVPIQVETNKVAGIGCGNFIEECRTHMDELSNNRQRIEHLMQMEAGIPGGMGSILGFELTDILKRVKPSGVSAYLHYCWVYLGRTIIKANNHSIKGPWTSLESASGSGFFQPETNQPSSGSLEADGGLAFQMPEIAHSWKQLTESFDGSGATAEGSVARCTDALAFFGKSCVC